MNFSVGPPRKVSDPGAPLPRAAVAIPVILATAVALITALTVGGPWGALAVVGTTLVVAELLCVDLLDGTHLPLGDAVLLVLVTAATGPQYALVVVGAVLLALPARHRLRGLAGAASERVVVAGAAYAGWWIVGLGAGGRLTALGGGALAVLGAHLAFRRLRREGSFRAAGGFAAWFAISASGVLMALAVEGAERTGGAMGLWGLIVFSVPVLATRWAFGRLQAIRSTYDQTIRMLSSIPEMGGRVRPGHARRVAALATAIGRELNLSRPTMDDLERAALLHSLGHVTLDDPEVRDRPVRADEVARATADVLLHDAGLEQPAELVAAMARSGRPGADPTSEVYLAAHALRAAAAFEDVAGGDPARARTALDQMASAGPDVHDARVVDLLERMVVAGVVRRAS